MWEQILKHYPTISLVFVVLLSIFTIVRIIMDTNNSAKTMAYILLVFLIPVVGAHIYFPSGSTIAGGKYSPKKVIANEALFLKIEDQLEAISLETLQEQHPNIAGKDDLIRLLINDAKAPLSYNKVKLLINGEQKFEQVVAAIEKAVSFIHIEYYIFDDDDIGNRIIDLLKTKAGEGGYYKVYLRRFWQPQPGQRYRRCYAGSRYPGFPLLRSKILPAGQPIELQGPP